MLNKLQLYSNIIPVRGFSRTLLIDLQFNELYFIPNHLLTIINSYNKKLDSLDKQTKDNLEDWINYLIEKELAFYTNKPDLFPPLNTDFYFPGDISNAIIYISLDNLSTILNENLFTQLDNLGCKALQLVISKNLYSFEDIISIYKSTENTGIEDIEIIISKTNENDICKWVEFSKSEVRIKKLYFFNIENSKDPLFVGNGTIMFFSTEDFSFLNCGIVSPKIFLNNLKFFTESQSYNTCLNRKIYVDEEGDIKNCPNVKKIYGNIKNTSLKEAILNPKFKRYWFIKKDDIDVCQDCEFRHICTDCRAFIKDPDNIYSQPSKCTYNPYIAKWKGQEDWINVEQWRKKNPDWERIAIENRINNKVNNNG